MLHFNFDFQVFLNFWLGFLEMVFPVHSESLLGLVLFSEWKFVEFYVRTCPAMFFKFALPFDHVFRFT